jgi:hypothetical protein
VFSGNKVNAAAACAVGDGAGGARVDVAVLLVDFAPIGQHDVDASWPDASEACAEMPHQALMLETGPNARLDPQLCLFWSPVVFHCSPRSHGLPFFHFGALW